MKKLQSKCLIFCLIAALLLPTAYAQESSLETSAQAAAQTAMAYSEAVSVQYALWQDGEAVLSGHVGVYSKTENTALTDDHLYGIGSISKVYTAAAMSELVTQGKVDLDKPVTTYLPDFKMADPRYKDITVRMLLNHSSGLMGSAGGNSFQFNGQALDYPLDHLLERLSTQTLQAAPGAYSVYSNDSFSLAQLVIERVSGMDFTQVLHKYFTEPMELENTLTPWDSFDRDRLARTYLGAETRHTPAETLAVLGTGGIYANANDLAQFGIHLSCIDRLMGDEYASGMWPEDSEGDALAYGLGWDSVHMFPFSQNGIQALVKGGDTLAYHAGLVVLPEYNMSCAVLSSGGNSIMNELAAARILIDALKEQGVEIKEDAALDKAEFAAMPEELTKLSGMYGTSTLVYQVGVEKDGSFSLEIFGSGKPLTAKYCADGSFRDEENSMLFRLIPEENGQVYLYQKVYSPLPGLTTMCNASYVAQRLPEYTPDAATQAAWTAREGKGYVQIDEHYSSALYGLSGVYAGVSFATSPSGYMISNQLTGPDEATPFVQIPGVGSRDSSVIECYDKDGVEYLRINGCNYMDAEYVNDIYPGSASRCTIQPGESAHWYWTGDAAGKTMTVQVPEKGGFYVYDAAMQLVASSWLYGDTSVVLPQDGAVVFAGDVGQAFHITLK